MRLKNILTSELPAEFADKIVCGTLPGGNKKEAIKDALVFFRDAIENDTKPGDIIAEPKGKLSPAQRSELI